MSHRRSINSETREIQIPDLENRSGNSQKSLNTDRKEVGNLDHVEEVLNTSQNTNKFNGLDAPRRKKRKPRQISLQVQEEYKGT